MVAARPDITLDDDLSEEDFAVADRIVPWLEGHPGLHSRSEIARGVTADYDVTVRVLAWLDRNVMVAADGNKSWRKYGARRQ